MSLAQKAFSFDEQMRFASASGDLNPMHVDTLAARRTQAGAPVVHGMNLLLWALDSLASDLPGLPPLSGLEAQFYSFVYLDELVHVDLVQQGPAGARLSLSVDNIARAKVVLHFGELTQRPPDWPADILEPEDLLRAPMSPEFEHISKLSGRVPFVMRPEDSSFLFPSATRWLGASRICAMAASTYLVGMVSPGLHSIYRELSLEVCAEIDLVDSLAFRVSKTDERFRLVVQEIFGGGVMGTVRCFARTPPVQQASMEALAGLVGPADYAGSIALIIGGSRGLGELTAKVIASGGGRTIVTWQTGRDDAERVAHEIRMSGKVCDALAYDSRKPVLEQLASLTEAPTHVYYFATPAIFKPQSQMFSSGRFKEFTDIYVEGFWQLSQALRVRNPKLSMFYPSSVAVTERPRGMTEYTMAKAAGEVLCDDINAFMLPLRVIVKRLPRLLTDQTASNTVVETASAIETMLPIIREVQA
ncbi:MAG: MaoC/PaaZ C-terminal domain-containing protein [Acidobacteriaceae bacterium]